MLGKIFQYFINGSPRVTHRNIHRQLYRFVDGNVREKQLCLNLTGCRRKSYVHLARKEKIV